MANKPIRNKNQQQFDKLENDATRAEQRFNRELGRAENALDNLQPGIDLFSERLGAVGGNVDQDEVDREMQIAADKVRLEALDRAQGNREMAQLQERLQRLQEGQSSHRPANNNNNANSDADLEAEINALPDQDDIDAGLEAEINDISNDPDDINEAAEAELAEIEAAAVRDRNNRLSLATANNDANVNNNNAPRAANINANVNANIANIPTASSQSANVPKGLQDFRDAHASAVDHRKEKEAALREAVNSPNKDPRRISLLRKAVNSAKTTERFAKTGLDKAERFYATAAAYSSVKPHTTNAIVKTEQQDTSLLSKFFQLIQAVLAAVGLGKLFATADKLDPANESRDVVGVAEDNDFRTQVRQSLEEADKLDQSANPAVNKANELATANKQINVNDGNANDASASEPDVDAKNNGLGLR